MARGVMYERALKAIGDAPEGLTVVELANEMRVAHYVAKRAVTSLVEDEKIFRTEKKRKASAVATNPGSVYSVDRKLAAEKMVRVPNLNPKDEAVPIINIVRAAVATPLDETDLVLQAKKVGYYVATLGRFAYEWKKRPDLIDRSEVRLFRMELRAAIVRIEWYLRLLKFLDVKESLWDNVKAYDAWFDDESIPVDPVEIYESLETIKAKVTQ